MNKGLITNLLALGLTIGGYFSPWFSQNLTTIGIFALSGSLTNWLALYMLFEKIPFIYGSGIILLHFESIKQSIRTLVMEEFFQGERISRLLENTYNKKSVDLLERIDYEKAFDLVKQTILESSSGRLIKTFGGEKVLDQYKGKIRKTLQTLIKNMMQDESLQENILAGVQILVEERLSTLTPITVKKIIQNMIYNHLEWLVVWGGVFGGLMGVVFSLILILGNR